MNMDEHNPRKKEFTWEQVQRRRKWVITGAAVLLYWLSLAAGIACGIYLPDTADGWIMGVFIACCIVPVIGLLMNLLLARLYSRRLDNQQVGEMQKYVQSHRENAEQTAQRKQRFITWWRVLSDLYAVGLGLCGFGVAFCAGTWNSAASFVPVMIGSGGLMLCALARIRLGVPERLYEEDELFLKPQDYPQLYALVQKAADALHCGGRIRIGLNTDFNASIRKEKNFCSIWLGVQLLGVYSQAELYAILLHEFSHIANEHNRAPREQRYFEWISECKTPHVLTWLENLLFQFWDMTYVLQYQLFRYSASILDETAADQAMIQYGDANAAASALVKLKYSELFEWEKGTRDRASLYEPEQLECTVIRDQITEFRQAMSDRQPDWDRLLQAEILSRSASHPTVQMRLDNMGIRTYTILHQQADDYQEECERAVQHADKLLYRKRAESYERDRQENYLEPLEKIRVWTEAGQPLSAEEYADIHDALRSLGRHIEADELCQRVIRELPEPACPFAYYMHGNFLIHRFDDRGIEYIYRAVENNSNFVDEGMNMIGTYSCLTGNQQELDKYREKAVEYGQKSKDIYSQLDGLKKGDDLSEEHLPDGMLESILNYIRSIEDGHIYKIFLVRKTITPEFFTSAFVIQFRNRTKAEIRDEIMHKIFCHLDTCSDWQFSLMAYEDMVKVNIESIENSCVYEAETDSTIYDQTM